MTKQVAFQDHNDALKGELPTVFYDDFTGEDLYASGPGREKVWSNHFTWRWCSERQEIMIKWLPNDELVMAPSNAEYVYGEMTDAYKRWIATLAVT